MPAIVALVAGNFPPPRRPAAYELNAAAGAIAVAAGPLIGGAVTTFASWRWVFVGESVIVAVILAELRGGPVLLGTSPVVWLVLGGLLVVYGFFLLGGARRTRVGEPLIRPGMLRNRQLAGGRCRE
jgi:MFS family permease